MRPNREEGHAPARPRPGARSARRLRWLFDCTADQEISHGVSILAAKCRNSETSGRQNQGPPAEGHKAEFDAWRWVALDALSDLIVPFKRDVYREVAEAFKAHAVPDRFATLR